MSQPDEGVRESHFFPSGGEHIVVVIIQDTEDPECVLPEIFEPEPAILICSRDIHWSLFDRNAVAEAIIEHHFHFLHRAPVDDIGH